MTKYKYLCLFAGYSAKGKIEEYVIKYISELSKFADVHYMADCDVEEQELLKLKQIIKSAKAQRHKCYDFGSWGLMYKSFSREELASYDFLILANDSCYAPLFSFDEMFNEMEKRDCDFWGCTENNIIKDRHIQSYFSVYSKEVFTSPEFINFFNNINEEVDQKTVVEKYEIGISKLLVSLGYKYSSYIDNKFLISSNVKDLLEAKTPFLKVKLFTCPGYSINYQKYKDFELLDLVKSKSNYNTSLITKHLDYLSKEYFNKLDEENKNILFYEEKKFLFGALKFVNYSNKRKYYMFGKKFLSLKIRGKNNEYTKYQKTRK